MGEFLVKIIKNICYVDRKLQISKKRIAFMTLLYITSTLLIIARTELIRTVFNFIADDIEIKKMFYQVALIIGVFALSIIVNTVIKSYTLKCKYRLREDISKKIVNKSLKMKTWKNNFTDTSDRYVIMDKEVDGYVEKIYSVIPMMISWIVMILIYVIYLCSISYIAVIVTFIVEIIVWRMSGKIQKDVSDLNEERRYNYRKWFVFLQRTFENLFLMRTTVNKEKYYSQYDKKAIDWNDSSINGLKKLLTMDQIQNAGGLLIDIVLLVIGLVQLLNGRMDIGAVYALITSVQQLKNEFKRIPEFVEDIYVTQSHNNRINEFFEKNDFIDEESKTCMDEKFNQGIKIENLSFGYVEQKNIIEDFTYHFDMGKMYAIVGNAGTGKTTLLLLIAKLLVYSKGSILFDEKDISESERENLWKHISYVSKPCFIKGNIYDNILWGNESDDNMKDIINSNETTLLRHIFKDEQGDELSAGEKQRLMIYRSVFSGREVLLLDEPFSNLDKKMEEKMFHLLLDAKKQGKCVIFTTHRKDYISKCDDVISFQKKGET
jgi:ABC-type bacteriocin/lantibiotic exporter with double-glycine peptidase domain